MGKKIKKEEKKEEVVEKSVEEKCEEYLTGWKRALADYDNLKKDLVRERDQMRKSTTERLARGLIDILGHFDQAMAHQPDLSDCAEDTKQWIAGMEHIRSAIIEELKSYGLDPVEPVEGEKFDPNIYEAIGSVSVENGEAGTIAELVTRGWKIGEKIIQPAKVITIN